MRCFKSRPCSKAEYAFDGKVYCGAPEPCSWSDTDKVRRKRKPKARPPITARAQRFCICCETRLASKDERIGGVLWLCDHCYGIGKTSTKETASSA